MSTAIAKLETGLVGENYAIEVTVDRIRTMMPIPQDAPNSAVLGLAQMCVALDLNPLVGEAYLGKFNGRYQPLVGTMGYEKEARKQSEFQYELTPMTAEELRRHRGDLYDGDDVGFKIKLWKLADAREWAKLGIPYKPIESYGFWMKKASWNKYDQKWTQDQIPKTWTKQMVAEKRAIRNSLKRAYSFTSFEKRALDHGASSGADEFNAAVYEVVEGLHEEEERRTAPIVERGLGEEVDDVLFSTPEAPEDDLSNLWDTDAIDDDNGESGPPMQGYTITLQDGSVETFGAVNQDEAAGIARERNAKKLAMVAA